MFLVGDERIDVAAGDFLFAPRDIPHAYVVRSERARIHCSGAALCTHLLSPGESDCRLIPTGVC